MNDLMIFYLILAIIGLALAIVVYATIKYTPQNRRIRRG